MAQAAKGRRDLLILLAILCVAAVLRLWDVTMPLVDVYSWRQASTAMMADNFAQSSWNIFYPEVNWTGPGPGYQGREFQVLSYLTAILHVIFGWHDWFGRAVAAAFGLLTTFAVHRLTAEVWDMRHAHLAALGYAILPGAVVIESSFLPDPPMLAFVTLGLWLFLRYWTGRAGVLTLILATALFTLGVLCKLPGIGAGLVVVWLLAQAVAGGRGAGHRGQVLPVLLCMGVGLLVVYAYYSWALYLSRTYPPFHMAGDGYIWQDGLRYYLDNAFFSEKLWKFSTRWFYGVPIIVTVAVGLWAALPRFDGDRALRHLPHVWLAAGVLLYLVAARQIANNPWNLHMVHVPVAMFMGRGALVLARLGAGVSRQGRTLRLIALAGLCLIFVTRPLMENQRWSFSESARQMGVALAALSQPGDLVIAASPDLGDPVGIYYSRRKGWLFPPYGDWEVTILPETEAEAIALLEDLRAQGAGWFGASRDARDRRGRYVIADQPELMAHLDATATLMADTDRYVIYRLSAE